MRTEQVAVAGVTLETIVVEGAREAPALVFLHEGLGSAALWRDFPLRLHDATGATAVIYSRAGNGFSSVLERPREPSYMHDEARIVLPALLRALEIERPVLVGHSDGASIALIYAGEYPGAVRGVAAIAPHVFVEDVSIASIAAIGVRYRDDAELRARMARHHADVDRTFFGWNDAWLSPRFRSWNIESFIGAIEAPVLCVQGTADEYGTLAQIDAIARRASRSVDRVVLGGCGHAPQRERPQTVAAAATAWYAEVASR
jgi:pimeloyl-ACP methyl ester carboxylesterase